MGRLFCLFIGWFVYLHNWSVRSQNAYLWIFESGITSILETPNFCLCAMTLKHVSFAFFLPFCPLSSFFTSFPLCPSTSPSTNSSIFVYSPRLQNLNVRKYYLSLVGKHHRSATENYPGANRSYFSCLNKFVVTEICTIQLNSILRQKQKCFEF